MSESFCAVVGPVGFLNVDTMCVESPRGQQLKRLGGHFYYKLIWELTRGDEWVVADSEDVHVV